MKLERWQYESLLERVCSLENKVGHYGEVKINPTKTLLLLLDYLGLELKQPTISIGKKETK